MNFTNYSLKEENLQIREEIYQIIVECSSVTPQEYNSLGFADVDMRKLKKVIKSNYQININEIDAFPSTTSIKAVIDFIISQQPKRRKFGTNEKNDNFEQTRNEVEYSQVYTTPTGAHNNYNMEKRKYEYIIGIDLGHGETSAAICPLQWNTPVEQLDPAKDLEMGGNKKVIPSAITVLDNGTAYIGDSAFDSEILKQADVNVCFKKAPQDIHGKAEKLMIRYMQEVYRRIRENNSAMLTDNNHLVYIATPSGWDKATQDLYLQMAKQAGLPIAGLTKESRAAFVRAHHDVTSGIGQYVEKGAVVFDMGSSTLDFTYMNSSKKLIDHGYDCGASFIEKTIFKQCEDKDAVIQRFENKYPRLVPFLLFEARKIKEQVYFDPSLKVRKTINFEDFIDDENFEDERFKMIFQPGELNSLLEQVGYIRDIENAARDFVCNHINNAPIYGVFLTGGASRMDFIKPLVSKCWNIPESQIYRDQDPSLTISQGVAEVARMDLRTEGMDDGLEDAINKLQNTDVVYDTFCKKFGAELYERICNTVGSTVTFFKDAQKNYSLSYLQNSITSNIEDEIEEVVSQISTYMQEAIAENTQDIQKKVEGIIAHYSNQGINIPKPSLNMANLQTENINLDNVLHSISNRIASESSNWAGAIAGAAIGGAIAILLGGPLAWLIGGAAFLGNLFFGKSEEEKKREAIQKELGREDRIKVYDSISAEWEDIQKQIFESIELSISSNVEIKQAIKETTYQLLQSYKESLKKARILID